MDSVGCLAPSKVYLFIDGSEIKAKHKNKKQKKVKTEEKSQLKINLNKRVIAKQ